MHLFISMLNSKCTLLLFPKENTNLNVCFGKKYQYSSKELLTEKTEQTWWKYTKRGNYSIIDEMRGLIIF